MRSLIVAAVLLAAPVLGVPRDAPTLVDSPSVVSVLEGTGIRDRIGCLACAIVISVATEATLGMFVVGALFWADTYVVCGVLCYHGYFAN